MLLIMTAERGGGRARERVHLGGGRTGTKEKKWKEVKRRRREETGQRVGAVANSAGRGDEFSCERVCVRARSRLKV